MVESCQMILMLQGGSKKDREKGTGRMQEVTSVVRLTQPVRGKAPSLPNLLQIPRARAS